MSPIASSSRVSFVVSTLAVGIGVSGALGGAAFLASRSPDDLGMLVLLAMSGGLTVCATTVARLFLGGDAAGAPEPSSEHADASASAREDEAWVTESGNAPHV